MSGDRYWIPRNILEDWPNILHHAAIIEVDHRMDMYLIEDLGTNMGISTLLGGLGAFRGRSTQVPYDPQLALQQAQMSQAQMSQYMQHVGLGSGQYMGPGLYYETPKKPLSTRKSKEPIVAQRSWGLTGEFKLRSTFTMTEWDGPILRSDQKPKPNVRVGDSSDDGHGIYAWHIGVPTLVHNTAKEQGFLGAVNGTVELKGRIIRHENGYRAETVRIRNLYLVELDGRIDRDEVIAALEERYQCDVTWHFTLGDIYQGIISSDKGRLYIP